MAKMNTNLDDWETDPDFVRDMDEMDQRWGNKRTVGSINMNELIDEVRRDHKTIRENNHHSSQLDYSSGLGRNAKPQVSQKTVSRKIITEKSERSYFEDATVLTKDPINKTIVDESSTNHKSNPTILPKPNMSDITSRLYSSGRSTFTPTSKDYQQTDPKASQFKSIPTDPPKQFKESSSTKRIFEEKSSSSLPRDNIPSSKSPSTGGSTSAAFKSIQDKIDAFKKEFEQIENKVAKKSDISKVIKKSTNVGRFDDTVEYVTRSTEKLEQANRPKQQRATTTSPTGENRSSSSGFRPSSTSPLFGDKRQDPKSSIKSLSERFESLGRETSEDFRRRMDERRREFFDEIKTQVRETRKGLDGFDVIDSDEEDSRSIGVRKQDSKSQVSTAKPKVYTKRETTQEEIVSKFVKENDRVIHDETKRNVERTSSCHGSSDEEVDQEPTSIKYITRTLKTSPQPASSSPTGELKRKEAFAEPASKSSGLMARTLYDYQAAESDELSFDVDDLITNIEKLDEGWYKGSIVKNGHKKVGLFPANYVKLLNDSSFY